ncbi:hypothetical protein RFI_33150 [Reticulomyxa filosa]|uniref:Uncharacterized protein n=1 Tax=Reticulomyxa filosa TaxID=46433 RepID=X6LU37_RETFI|nr:hypothetical protein RFI_33150 [Reticulomyxa filosa]|eukprot:ETO04245.1 hypothetical protein RFI_33150 [Reticulomyxa filosa]
MNWALMEDMVAQGGGSSAFGDGTGMDIVNGTTIPLNPERVISEAEIMRKKDEQRPYLDLGTVKIHLHPTEPIDPRTGRVNAFVETAKETGNRNESKIDMDSAANDLAFIRHARQVNFRYLGDPVNGPSIFATGTGGVGMQGYEETQRLLEELRLRIPRSLQTFITWYYEGYNLFAIRAKASQFSSYFVHWIDDLLGKSQQLSRDEARVIGRILLCLRALTSDRSFKNLNLLELQALFGKLLKRLCEASSKRLGRVGSSDSNREMLAQLNECIVTGIKKCNQRDGFLVCLQLLNQDNLLLDELQEDRTYPMAVCKLFFHSLKKFHIICKDNETVKVIWRQIRTFFQNFDFAEWQKFDENQRKPLRIIQTIISRIVLHRHQNAFVLYQEATEMKSSGKYRPDTVDHIIAYYIHCAFTYNRQHFGEAKTQNKKKQKNEKKLTRIVKNTKR